MQDTAHHVKLKPFFFADRSKVAWWLTGKGFQTDIVPIEIRDAPTGIVHYKESKESQAPTSTVSYKKNKK